MLVFISCAKTMAARCSVVVPEVTVPKFETEAVRNALEMSQYSVSELERLLRVNTKIAAENRLRFHDFCSEENRSMPAVCAYTGAVFKRILPKDFSAEDFRYAQEHLRITSFLYGLLRPLDGIKPYRLEGDVRLPEKGGISMFDYWKYNPQIQISAESETKRSIFREKDKTKRSKKESAQHSKSRNKSFVMTSVSAL